MRIRLLPPNHEEGWTPYAWLVYIVPFACWPGMLQHSSPAQWAWTGAGLLAFLALYFRGYWECGRRLVVILTAIGVLGLLYWPANPGAGAFFIYAAAFAGELEPTPQAAVGIAAIEIAILIEVCAYRMPWFNAFWPAIFSVLVGAINIFYRQKRTANARLRLAHDEIERLAKTAERERIARDLHDILGHTLSVIILKSELASKIAERDIERARVEIRDVERISRDALAQVRAAVRGYREGGLQSELHSLQSTLTSAGIEVKVVALPLTLPAGHEAVLALAIREAVTNIVRHSRARHCEITIEGRGGRCVATVHDDGIGGNAPSGIGLTGMHERVVALGGTLSRDGSKGTTITIALPLAAAFPGELTA